MLLNSPDFTSAWLTLGYWLRSQGQRVKTERWQGTSVKDDPSAETYELLNVTLQVPLNNRVSLDHWRDDIKPNLPWADNHFEERVCGRPINPGIEWKNWPWGKNAAKFLDDNGQFNHNYMERYWPKHAGKLAVPTKDASDYDLVARDTWGERSPPKNLGIRHAYGDLNDLVDLLAFEPYTRQAYLPIFFPEDTGIGDGGRKPCTLGYQFIQRNNQLHVYYPMRSCDYARHFRDDCYLTVRLLLWVLHECTELNPKFWRYVGPGTYTMHMTSLHVFKNDAILLWHTEGQGQ